MIPYVDNKPPLKPTTARKLASLNKLAINKLKGEQIIANIANSNRLTTARCEAIKSKAMKDEAEAAKAKAAAMKADAEAALAKRKAEQIADIEAEPHA